MGAADVAVYHALDQSAIIMNAVCVLFSACVVHHTLWTRLPRRPPTCFVFFIIKLPSQTFYYNPDPKNLKIHKAPTHPPTVSAAPQAKVLFRQPAAAAAAAAAGRDRGGTADGRIIPKKAAPVGLPERGRGGEYPGMCVGRCSRWPTLSCMTGRTKRGGGGELSPSNAGLLCAPVTLLRSGGAPSAGHVCFFETTCCVSEPAESVVARFPSGEW